MTNIRPFSRQMVVGHLRKMLDESVDELDISMLEAAVRYLEPRRCQECGGELGSFCLSCNSPLAEYQPITDAHKDGRRLVLTSRARFWSEPAEVGFWNSRCSRWEVLREGERPILYGPWVFTHAREVE